MKDLAKENIGLQTDVTALRNYMLESQRQLLVTVSELPKLAENQSRIDVTREAELRTLSKQLSDAKLELANCRDTLAKVFSTLKIVQACLFIVYILVYAQTEALREQVACDRDALNSELNELSGKLTSAEKRLQEKEAIEARLIDANMELSSVFGLVMVRINDLLRLVDSQHKIDAQQLKTETKMLQCKLDDCKANFEREQSLLLEKLQNREIELECEKEVARKLADELRVQNNSLNNLKQSVHLVTEENVMVFAFRFQLKFLFTSYGRLHIVIRLFESVKENSK